MPLSARVARILALSALTTTTAISLAHATAIDATSRASAVTLHPDAAIVRREAVVDIPAGEHEIILADLPASLDPASFRVEGGAAERVSIGGVDFRAAPAQSGAQTPEAIARLKTLRAERDRVSDRLDAVEGRRAMIQRMAQVPQEKDGKTLPVEDWARAWEIVGKGLDSANAEIRTLRDELARIDAEIATLAAPPALPLPRGVDVRRIAAISVSAAAGTKLTLSVSYRVRNAGWRPVYDAKLATSGAKPALELVRRAMIRQNTGEDWKDVSLALSTLPVMRGTAAPELRGVRIGFYEPPRPMNVGRAASGSLAVESAAPAAPAPGKAQSDQMEAKRVAEEVSARVDAGAYQTEFVLPGRVTIATGAAEKGVRLGAETVNPDLLVRSAPVLDPKAYLQAAFAVTGETAILPGEVILIRDGAFIGRGRLPLVPPGESVKLGFGADDRVTIRRAAVGRKARDPGFLGSQRSEDSRFRITVRNLHPFPVGMRIEDRVPVSEDQAIVVERLSDMTKPDIETPDERRGVVAWTPILKPQEEKAFVTAYRIRWPAGRDTRAYPLPR